MHLTASHWIYLAVVALAILGMALRRGILPLCVLGTLVVGWVYTHSWVKGIQTVFNANLASAENLLGIMVVIGLMIALLRLVERTGADQLVLRPFRHAVKTPGLAFWGLGLVKGVVSLLVWPTPATMMVAPLMTPIALRAGLPLIGAAMAMNLFGHGIALSGDFIIQGAPKLTSSGAGVSVTSVIQASIPLVLTTGAVSTVLAYFLLRRDMARGRLVVEEAHTAAERVHFGISAKLAAVLVPAAFLFSILVTVFLPLRGGDATALMGGVALLVLCVVAFAEYGRDAAHEVMSFVQEGFAFSARVFGPVIPIAGFFLLGSPEVAPQILGPGAPGFLFDLGRALAHHVPLSVAPVAALIVLVGVIAGLDGSGFSGLVLVGTLAQALGQPIGANVAVLAALGQMGSVWSGGGTLVPWGVLDIAGVTGCDAERLTRRNFVPVVCGLAAATAVAIAIA
ncbi:hypothetical protein [Alicyclobacillus vulcanalis]|uniref:H+/gluconate symporter n=1 Tax=Alicyclobacillus vulcanalis TaxID=252246 RepID=A0A1N7M4Y1_9BACL|nr:hypothetical protein [Alicyclobacillus vulcanalis]SIS81127.1 hypothetical protein SAMN05421799_104228 [Alicyclobacillus vulcanalis]